MHRRRRFVPTLDRLEDRIVPAQVQLAQVGTVLTIIGTPGIDSIDIIDNGFGTLSVICNPDPTARFFVNVNAVNVDLGKGNDILDYQMTTGGAFFSLTITAAMGKGRDTFTGLMGGADLPFAVVRNFDIRGQGGSDTLSVDATANVDVFQGGALNVALYGADVTASPGIDKGDLIQFSYLGFLAGSLRFVGDAGKNPFPDTISAIITTTPGSNGTLFAREFGYGGRDVLTMTIENQRIQGGTLPTAIVQVDALIDGGAKVDKITVVGNVRVINP